MSLGIPFTCTEEAKKKGQESAEEVSEIPEKFRGLLTRRRRSSHATAEGETRRRSDFFLSYFFRRFLPRDFDS